MEIADFEPSKDEGSRTSPGIVSGKMGRCILRLQQYELLMKHLIAHHEFAGHIEDMEAINETRKRLINEKKTLGCLLKNIKGSFLGENDASIETVESHECDTDPTRAHFRYRFSLEMDPDAFNKTKKDLDQLLDLRNFLVHGFLGKFDLNDVLAQAEAEKYLDEAFELINTRHLELCDWAERMNAAAAAVLQYMETEDYQSFFFYGFVPGKPIDWSITRIASELQLAEDECNDGGWTNLDCAILFIRNRSPSLTPKVYGCNSWRHIIHETRLFEIQKRLNLETGKNETWYRSKRVDVKPLESFSKRQPVIERCTLLPHAR